MAETTLLYFTRNRPAHIREQLDILRRQGNTFPVLIADGSDPEPAAANAARIAEQQGSFPLRHCLFPPELPPQDRILAILPDVETPFVFPCADDDYPCVAAIGVAQSLMAKTPRAAAVQGLTATIDTRVGHDRDHLRPYPRSVLEQKFPAKRLKLHLMRYNTTFFSLRRPHQLEQSMRGAQILRDDVGLWELAESALTVLQGQLLMVDEPLLLRTFHGANAGQQSQGLLQSLLFDPVRTRDLRRCADLIAGMLNEGGRATTLPQALSLVEECLARYILDQSTSRQMVEAESSQIDRLAALSNDPAAPGHVAFTTFRAMVAEAVDRLYPVCTG